MARVRIFTAILMISVLFPATVELVENVAHYVNHGHFSILEATWHHHHAPESEGCCAGTCGTHVCGFNLAQLFPGGRRVPDLGRRAHERHRFPFAEAGALRDGFSTLPYRPPIA